jgi:hypothetical protein
MTFVPLPLARELLTDDPFWRYTSACLAGEGIAHLRVWATSNGHLAILSETGVGATITNSANEIWAAVGAAYGADGLIVLEHWPAGDGIDTEEHLDQMMMADDGRPSWRRIWPTPATNPHHGELEAWMRTYGHDLLAASGRGR